MYKKMHNENVEWSILLGESGGGDSKFDFIF